MKLPTLLDLSLRNIVSHRLETRENECCDAPAAALASVKEPSLSIGLLPLTKSPWL